MEAVRFGNAEEMVVAGSMSGALKLWDLEQAKSEFWYSFIVIFCTKTTIDLEIIVELDSLIK